MFFFQVSHIIVLFIIVEVTAIEKILSNNNNLITNINDKINILTEEYLETQFPFLAKSCSKRAVSSFIPLCVQDGSAASIEERIKVETSIKLSICEFENSGLQDWIPQGCFLGDQPTDTIECMAGLKIGGGQWWTTYSGYYQNLNELCYQYSLPFQQEQLLETYVNLTDMVEQVTNFWSEEIIKMGDRSELVVNEHVENISNFFNELLDELLMKDTHFKEMVNSRNKEFINNITTEQEVSIEEFRNFNEEINYSIQNVGFLINEVVTQMTQNNISNDIQLMKGIKNDAIDLAMNQNQILEDSFSLVQYRVNSVLSEILLNLTYVKQDTIDSIKKYANIMKNMDSVDKKIGDSLSSLDNIENKLLWFRKEMSLVTNTIFSLFKLAKNAWLIIPIYFILRIFRSLGITKVPTVVINIFKIVLVIILGKFLGNIPKYELHCFDAINDEP